MTYIDRSRVSLRFSCEDLDPDQLHNLLEFSPSDEAVKPIVKTIRGKTYWSVGYSEGNAAGIEKKIENLLDWFTDNLARWEEISGRFDGEIFCGLFLDNWNEGFALSPKLLKKLGDRRLSIGFDIYPPTNPTNETRK